MEMETKNRPCRHNTIRPRFRHRHKYTKYKKCLSMMMLICIKQHLATFEAQFLKMLSSAEAELKKNFAYKKYVY